MILNDTEYNSITMKTILFDNDGTLVDSETLYFKATQQVLRSAGVDITKKWFAEEFLLLNTSTLSLARAKGLTGEQIDTLRNQRNALYAKLLEDEVILMPGVFDVLQQLHGHHEMGVVTGSRRSHFEIIMRKTGIKNFFNFYITREDTEKEKPDPEPYLKALQVSWKKPHECIAIEDTSKWLLSASRANIPCLVIPNELSKDHDFSLATKIVWKFSEITSYLLENRYT